MAPHNTITLDDCAPVVNVRRLCSCC